MRTRLRPAMVSRGGSRRWSWLTVHWVDALLDKRVGDVASRPVGDRSVGESASVLCVLLTSSSSASSLGVRLHATETRSARFVNVVWLLELRKPIKAKLATD